MTGKGPREERETVIIFNDSDELAELFTCSETIYRRMKKRGWSPSEDYERSASFTFPKKLVKLPRAKGTKGRGKPFPTRKLAVVDGGSEAA